MEFGKLLVTGTVTLAADPVSGLQASTKNYVDNAITNAISTDTYTASSGLLLTGKNFTANTTGVTTGLVSNNIAVRSTATLGQVLLSSGTAGTEATWGALNLASANAVTGILPLTDGGTGANSAANALVNLGALPEAGGTMTGALLVAAGTVALPGLSFSGDTDTGIFHAGANEYQLVANAAAVATVSAGAMIMNATLTLLADPVSALQAATKEYVDNAAASAQANAIAADTYTASPAGGLTLTSKAFSANTTGVTTALVSGNIAVRSTGTVGQTLLSTGTAGNEASWGALNLASANAVANSLALANGGTGGTSAATARANLVVPSIYRESFTSASLSSNLLTVTHNLGQQFVQATVTDNSNNMIMPDNITMTSTTVTTIDLTSFNTTNAVVGTWNVVVIG